LKKLFLLILICSPLAAFSREVLAPAVQFNLNDYKDYFKKSTDYKINLKSRYDYKITCNSDIIGIVWGDTDNIKMFDKKNEAGEIIDMKSTILKVKYETYTYIRLYKANREITNLIVSVNPIFNSEINKSLGTCALSPYSGEE